MGKNIISEAELIKRMNQKEYEMKNILTKKLLSGPPIPEEELQLNLVLFQDRRVISRILYLNEIYEKILNIHGCIFNFGVRYGHNESLFTSMRGIYEPYNHNRKIVGFDTFSGFPSVNKNKDSNSVNEGDYAVTENYEQFLDKLLLNHEHMAPLSNIKKFELVKGDATKTIHEYLSANPETIISLAYFDFDIYEPTMICLEAILPHLNRGAILAFDEINMHDWPGESLALKETLSLSKYRLVHSKYRAAAAYLVFE
jgi:hypothetical protein